jgi:hypothetical protein
MRNKNDAADATAICGAMRRSTMRFVRIKTEEQQALLKQPRTRDLLMPHPRAQRGPPGVRQRPADVRWPPRILRRIDERRGGAATVSRQTTAIDAADCPATASKASGCFFLKSLNISRPSNHRK